MGGTVTFLHGKICLSRAKLIQRSVRIDTMTHSGLIVQHVPTAGRIATLMISNILLGWHL